jgi:hypothetical protein
MISRQLKTSVAAGVAVIAIAGGAYGIVGASSSGSSTATASTSTASKTATTSTNAKVIPFQRGNPSPAKVVGTVPKGWTAGAGKPVTGAAADKAKAAAAAAYPGGTINRVVKLSSGDYNVHIIGVNWPHHVFVNSSFKVIGAE